MSEGLPIRCHCGQFAGMAGHLAPGSGLHIVCYCDNCRAFAKRLQRSEILDAHGGTAVYQMSPAAITIDQGLDQLACLRLTTKGPLRWYTRCCLSPIGNTPPTYQMPFLGLILSCLDTAERSPEEVLGPVRFHSMTRHAKGDVARLPNAHAGFSGKHIALAMLWLARWRLRGDHRRSPFFDPVSGSPIAVPEEPRRG